jgi:hypothetical protein
MAAVRKAVDRDLMPGSDDFPRSVRIATHLLGNQEERRSGASTIQCGEK